MSHWFYESMGQVVGPLSSAQLLQKVRAGDIGENTRVRKDDSQWVNAVEVNGLFSAAKRQLVQYKCPYCGGAIDLPPTICLQCDREVTAAYRKREKLAPAAPPPETPAKATAKPAAESPAEAQPAPEATVVTSVIGWLKSLVR